MVRPATVIDPIDALVRRREFACTMVNGQLSYDTLDVTSMALSFWQFWKHMWAEDLRGRSPLEILPFGGGLDCYFQSSLSYSQFDFVARETIEAFFQPIEIESMPFKGGHWEKLRILHD